MENRIELERRGLNKSEVVELVLDNCRSTSIIGLTDEYCHLEKLSLINVGLTSLKGLPSLPRLRKIELSDNRITSGLEYLLKTPQLTHLSLSGNKIKDIASLAPLAKLSSLKSLDLFNCDVTTEKEYRNKVFELIPQLKFLDGADRDQEELEDTEEEGDDEEVDEEDDEDDPDELQSEGARGKGEKEEADEDAEDDVEDEDEPNPEGGADVDEEEEGESDEEDEQNQLQGDVDEEEEDELDDEDEDNEPGLDYLNKDDFSDEDEDGDFAPGEDDDDDDEEIDEEATEEEHATRGTKRKHEGDEDA